MPWRSFVDAGMSDTDQPQGPSQRGPNMVMPDDRPSPTVADEDGNFRNF